MAMADRIAKAEETTRVALEIIVNEANARENKTKKLREARLAMEANAKAETLPKQRKTKS